MKTEFLITQKTMGNGMSDISSPGLVILEPCDKRYRGYILNSLGDYFNTALSADMSYGNYHAKDNKYYLSKCVIVRRNVIYFIDGKKTITINHKGLLITKIEYLDNYDKSNITAHPNNMVFGQQYAVSDLNFNKMLNDPEYAEFYKKMMAIVLRRDISIKNRFMCGMCIKSIANVGLACGHLAYCKECFDVRECHPKYTCFLCLAINETPAQKQIIDLAVFD